MLTKEQFERIGVIGRAHGINGEVSMRLEVEIAPLLEEGERLFLMLEIDGLLIPFAVEQHRYKAGDVDLVRFSGIATKEQAEALVGLSVWLDKDYIGEAELSSDPYEWSRYQGYRVEDARTGAYIGTITHVEDSTLNTLLYVLPEGADESGEILLPIAEALLVAYDDQAQSIKLAIPEGLLDDTAEYDIH